MDLLAKAFASMQAQNEQTKPAYNQNQALEAKVEQMFQMQLEMMKCLNNLSAPGAPVMPNHYTDQPPSDRKHKGLSTPTKAPSKRGKHTSNAGTDQDIPRPPDPADSTNMHTEPTSQQQEAKNMIQTPIRTFTTPPQASTDNLYGNLDDDDILEAMHAQTAQNTQHPSSLSLEPLGTRSKGNKAKKC